MSRQTHSTQTVSVDNRHCQLYGVCVQEAAKVFQLDEAGRLRYDAHPDPAEAERVRQAVRLCPAQAIEVSEE